jgi:hypothetical protein
MYGEIPQAGTFREAQCRCGSLMARCIGEPIRVSVCHCLECQRRTGSAFSYNATFHANDVRIVGDVSLFGRDSDDGNWVQYRFCPRCGSTIAYELQVRPGMVSIPAGAFADVDFPAPSVEVYGERRHRWCELVGEIERQA